MCLRVDVYCRKKRRSCADVNGSGAGDEVPHGGTYFVYEARLVSVLLSGVCVCACTKGLCDLSCTPLRSCKREISADIDSCNAGVRMRVRECGCVYAAVACFLCKARYDTLPTGNSFLGRRVTLCGHV